MDTYCSAFSRGLDGVFLVECATLRRLPRLTSPRLAWICDTSLFTVLSTVATGLIQVHFLDLERLDAWVVTPPPPAMARGRVCALTIAADIAAAGRSPSQAAQGGERGATPPGSTASASIARSEHPEPPRHLVAVLETGAVFVVLLERSRPLVGDNSAGSRNSEGVDKDGENVNSGKEEGTGNGDGDGGGGRQRLDYVRLGADQVDKNEFSPLWLDVGRGASGGGGGGMGVRFVPPAGQSRSGAFAGADEACRRLRMSIVSRAWGNKCSVKMVRLAATPDAGSGDKEGLKGRGRERGGGRKHALRTETVRQVSLPVDHPSPEQHGLAAVDGFWALLASPPTSGAPTRVTVAPLGRLDRPAAAPARVFLLPPGENISGVALVRGDHAGDAGHFVPTAGSAENNRDGGGSWGLVWTESCIYRVDIGWDGRASSKTKDTGRSTSALLPPPPLPPPQVPPPPLPRHSARTVRHNQGTSATGSIAIRRPSAASVRHARDLHAAGRLAEAAQAAIKALDGNLSAGTASGRGSGSPPGREEAAGGGVTTRMVREDLANSLLEWLITLHAQRSRTITPPAAAPDVPGGAGAAGNSTTNSHRPRSESIGSAKQGLVRPVAGKAQTRGVRRGQTRSSSTARSLKNDPKQHPVTEEESLHSLAPTAQTTSRLERYLLSSLDYDPVLAATLLHSHGEADLAVVAGASRGSAALLGVLRVLAESAWPSRLGLRAVEALCDSEVETAALDAVCAGGGSLLAALEPRLQLRLLLSDRRIMFGGDTVGGNPKKAKSGSVMPAGDTAVILQEEGGVIEAPAGAVAGAADIPRAPIAGVRSHLGPIVPALSVEDLARLVAQLAQWCKEDAAHATGHPGEESGDTPAQSEIVSDDDDRSPPAASLEALEVLLEALCQLSGREPPAGANHRRAWLEAGCVGEGVHGGGDSPISQEEENDASIPTDGSLPENEASRGSANVSRALPTPERDCRGPPLGWVQVVTSLCAVLENEGIRCGIGVGSGGGSGGGGGDQIGIHGGVRGVGGLPTAARRALLRALPLMRGWHDPVGVLLRSRGSGCWAAVALELEQSGDRREAASAILHGIATLLQVGVI